MVEDMKKFLEAASSDETLRSSIEALAAGKTSVEDVISLAASKGFKLDKSDLLVPGKKALTEISEDELAAVAGGTTYNPKAVTSVCRCDGYGSGLTWELDCQCHDSGNGYNATNGHWRCGCTGQGLGLA